MSRRSKFLGLTVLIATIWMLPQGAVAEVDAYAPARQQMVQGLAGPRYHITDARVLAAMGRVKRHEFVPESVRAKAYQNQPLPIGYGQPISEPFVVAFMTEQLELKPSDRVLEIGTGSGYQAAVLSELAKEVYTIEIIPTLAERAAAALRRVGYAQVHTRMGDGYAGWPEAAPFDAIIVTCAPQQVPPPLIDQLKDGGRMILPLGSSRQQLVVLRKHDGKLDQQALLPIRFVPMTGAAEVLPPSPKRQALRSAKLPATNPAAR